MVTYFSEIKNRYLTNENFTFSKDRWLIRGGKNIVSELKNKPGVYVIYLDGILSYIGQSNTLRFR